MTHSDQPGNRPLNKALIKTTLSSLLISITGTCVAQLTAIDDPGDAGFIADRLARIDTVMHSEIAKGNVPGTVVLVARNGKIAYHKSFGLADVDSKTGMQNDSIFRIASMSKAVTSVAAMILYEQGRFQLSDPISNFIPAFANMTVMSETGEDGGTTIAAAVNPIRVIDLLSHTSGISYPFIASRLQQTYTEAGVIDGLTIRDVRLAEQMELLAKQPLLFEPGSEWAYGLSSDLLGYLVEVVSGKPLDQFFSEEIFAPLGMHDTYFYLPDDKADRLVTLYADIGEPGVVVSKGDESNIKLDNPRYPVEGARSYFSGGAGLSSTALDYAKFCQMLLNNGRFGDAQLISRKSVELMRSPRSDIDQDGSADFGLGFYVVTDLGQGRELGSAGTYSWGGAFNTSFWLDPEEQLIGVIMGQVRPVHSNINNRLRTLIYQALE